MPPNMPCIGIARRPFQLKSQDRRIQWTLVCGRLSRRITTGGMLLLEAAHPEKPQNRMTVRVLASSRR
jgi:hypothetical protein